RVSSVFEWSGVDETAALVDGRRVCGIERRALGLDALALRVGAVARLEAQVRGLRVVPPRTRVVRDAEDDRVADLRREERAAHELHQVVVAEIRREHATVARRGEGRSDAQAHRLDAVAVEVEAREALAEALAHAVEPIGAPRTVGIDALRLPVVAGHMVGAREHDALHAVLSRRLI